MTMRSKVWPSLCVGPVTCCLRPKDSRRSENFIASESWILSTCMLKSPDINKFSLEKLCLLALESGHGLDLMTEALRDHLSGQTRK